MFCGLCAEACPFESFFMTNEYDGMTGYTREQLWMDASRTRLLPAVHQERVDMELAKRAEKEKKKRAKKDTRPCLPQAPLVDKLFGNLQKCSFPGLTLSISQITPIDDELNRH